jgi:hypothetical protein
MKKILCTLAVVGLAVSVHAQGTVTFANSSSTLVKMKEPTQPDSAAVNLPAQGGFVQLLWAPQGTAFNPINGTLASWLTANPAWKAVPESIRVINPAGRFNAGTLTLPTATPGAVVEAAVIGWKGNAASYDAAFGASEYTGASTSAFTVDTGNPLATPIPDLAASITGAGQFSGLIVTAVPEPSSMALVGLGAAALLVFRRRK